MKYTYHLSIPINIHFVYESDDLLPLNEVSKIISNDLEGEGLIDTSFDGGSVNEDFHYNITNNPHLIRLFSLESDDGIYFDLGNKPIINRGCG